LLEKTENTYKIVPKNSLEEVLDNIDILALTSSKTKKDEIVKITKDNPDRSKLFPYEKEKYKEYFIKIKDYGFDGILLLFANPIGHLLEYGRRLGLNPH